MCFPYRPLAIALLALSATALHASANCDPRAFGAKGDGVTKDTAAIQKAIDACDEKGGGTVQLTAGTYLSAPIVLKSKITLQLDKGATLLGSPDHADYPPITMFHLPDLQPLVSATNATNVAITGEGTIDGNGTSWWQRREASGIAAFLARPPAAKADHLRPLQACPRGGSHDPEFADVATGSLLLRRRDDSQRAGFWRPQHSPNTDAIDPFSSSNVRDRPCVLPM